MLRIVLVSVFVAATVALGVPGASVAQVGVAVTVAPPPLPVFAQPPIPGPGYLWTPGYWAWGSAGYFWVPGTWVRPPTVGLLWTPGFWGWGVGGFLFHAGFWGPTVGFYGGINYGFGYTGVGFAGGYWNHGNFFYNRSVNNISNTRITNVYNREVTVNRTTNVSFNGGNGGIAARPSPAELAAAHQGVAPTAAQLRHQTAAGSNHALLASVNHGNPPIAATAKAGEFTHGVVAAHGAAPVSPAAGAEHRPAAIAGGKAAPQEGRVAPPPARPGTPEGAAQQRAAAHERAMQPPGAPENAAQQRAAQERAAQQRAAAHERAAQPRGAPENAAQQRAAQERAAQQRAAQERAAQQRATHEQRPAERANCRVGEPGCPR